MPPWIAARHFTTGRIAQVDVLVIHTAEGATSAYDLGRYFATTDREASAHSGVDDTGARVDYVRPADTAWAAPGANADGEHLELCGFAAWQPPEWAGHPRMLDAAARWLADRSYARDIPLLRLDAEDLRANRRGVCGHVDVTNAFHRSTHTDPGPSLPWDQLLARARGYVTTLSSPAVPPHTEPVRQPPPYHQVLRNFTRNDDVWLWQRRMRQRGWRIGIDGAYGPKSEAVCKAFQHEKDLRVDGLVGPLTWRATWRAPIT